MYLTDYDGITAGISIGLAFSIIAAWGMVQRARVDIVHAKIERLERIRRDAAQAHDAPHKRRFEDYDIPLDDIPLDDAMDAQGEPYER
jgi:hypothetical protein